MWKDKIQKQVKHGSKLRKIGSPLKKLVKLLLQGDNEFDLIYSSSRDEYVFVRMKTELSNTTAKLLLKNGYKNLYQSWK